MYNEKLAKKNMPLSFFFSGIKHIHICNLLWSTSSWALDDHSVVTLWLQWAIYSFFTSARDGGIFFSAAFWILNPHLFWTKDKHPLTDVTLLCLWPISWSHQNILIAFKIRDLQWCLRWCIWLDVLWLCFVCVVLRLKILVLGAPPIATKPMFCPNFYQCLLMFPLYFR